MTQIYEHRQNRPNHKHCKSYSWRTSLCTPQTNLFGLETTHPGPSNACQTLRSNSRSPIAVILVYVPEMCVRTASLRPPQQSPTRLPPSCSKANRETSEN